MIKRNKLQMNARPRKDVREYWCKWLQDQSIHDKKHFIENNKHQIFSKIQNLLTGDNMKSISKTFLENNQLEGLEDLDSPVKEMQILRIGMVEEAKAVNLYEKLSNLTSNEKVRKIFLDVAREEKVHFSEFETMLKNFDTEFVDSEKEAQSEVSQKF